MFLNSKLSEKEVNKVSLSVQQKQAANHLINRDLNGMSLQEVADDVGVSYRQLLRWRQDPEFIEYQNELSELIMTEFITESYSELRKLMRGSKDSLKLKAIELILKNRGKLKDTSDVKVEVMQKSNKELEEEINSMLERVNLDLE
jgi:transcriptional regulator with XRE-family HTH domain